MNSINANTSFSKRASIRLIFLFMRKSSETFVHYSHAPVTCGYASLFLSISQSIWEINKRRKTKRGKPILCFKMDGDTLISLILKMGSFCLVCITIYLFFLSFARIKNDLLCTYAARDGSKTPFYARNMQKLWQIVFKSLWAYELQWSSKFF